MVHDFIDAIVLLFPLFLFLYFVLCLGVEKIVTSLPNKKIQKNATYVDKKRDIKNSIGALFFASASLSLGITFKQAGFGYDFDFTGNAILNFFIEFILGLILFDTSFYWLHRLFHWNKFCFKKFHSLHHKNNAPTVWGSYNETLEDSIFLQSFFIYAIFIIPISIPALIAVNLYTLFLDVVGHCGYNLVLRIPYSGMTIISDHDLHHKKYNCNYAPYFTIWDRVMGTYKDPDNI